jgi:biopolymer transport protein ExbD
MHATGPPPRLPGMETQRTYRRRSEPINAGSMADIAFLLLIFFLVTTTMDTELGLPRLLPPMTEAPPSPIADQNLLLVQLNDAGELMVADERIQWQELSAKAAAFLTNPEGRDDLPRMLPITETTCLARLAELGDGPERAAWQQRLNAVHLIGPYNEPPPQAQMLVQAGSGVAYADYIALQDLLEGVVADLRDDLCRRAFGKAYDVLDPYDGVDRERIQAIKRAIPMRLGDAEVIIP